MRARTRMSILDSVQNFVQTYCDVNTHWKYIPHSLSVDRIARYHRKHEYHWIRFV
jgi:hypothetical protein